MKWPRAILALYVLVWFNVVVPGHTRGVITLPKHGAPDLKAQGGCCHPAGDSCDGKPTPDQKHRCAICFVAGTYTAATPIEIDLGPTGEVASAVVCIDQSIVSLDYPPAFYPTGPPLS